MLASVAMVPNIWGVTNVYEFPSLSFTSEAILLGAC